MTLGEKIHSLRESKNISLEDFSHEINVDIVTLLQYESNNLEPSLSQIKLIAYKLGVSVDDLLDITQDSPKDVVNQSSKPVRSNLISTNITKDPLKYLITSISAIYGTLFGLTLIVYILIACLIEPLIAIGLIYPLITVPFFIYDIVAIKKCESKHDLTAPGVLSIFFVNLIVGILMLCVNDANALAHKYYLENKKSASPLKLEPNNKVNITPVTNWFKKNWKSIVIFISIYLVIWGICLGLYFGTWDKGNINAPGFDSIGFMILPIPLGALLGCIILGKKSNKIITYTLLSIFIWTFTLDIYLTLYFNFGDFYNYKSQYNDLAEQYFARGNQDLLALVFIIPAVLQIIIFVLLFLSYKNKFKFGKMNNKKNQKVIGIISLVSLLIGSIAVIVGVTQGVNTLPDKTDFEKLEEKLYQDRLDNTSRSATIEMLMDVIRTSPYNHIINQEVHDYFSYSADFDKCSASYLKIDGVRHLGFNFTYKTEFKDDTFIITSSMWLKSDESPLSGKFTLNSDSYIDIEGKLVESDLSDIILLPTDFRYNTLPDTMDYKKGIIQANFKIFYKDLMKKFIHLIDIYLNEYNLYGYATRLLDITDKNI